MTVVLLVIDDFAGTFWVGAPTGNMTAEVLSGDSRTLLEITSL